MTVFCPSDRSELVDLLTEDILLDLSQPLYLNFTHTAIVERLEKHYEAFDRITGDVYACENPPSDTTAEEYVLFVIIKIHIIILVTQISLQDMVCFKVYHCDLMTACIQKPTKSFFGSSVYLVINFKVH